MNIAPQPSRLCDIAWQLRIASAIARLVEVSVAVPHAPPRAIVSTVTASPNTPPGASPACPARGVASVRPASTASAWPKIRLCMIMTRRARPAL